MVGTIIFLAASLGWLYLAGIAVLVGGEINAGSERQAAAQAGHPGARQSARQVEEGSAQPSGNTASK